MAAAQTSDLFKCTPEQFYQIVCDYEKYPEFLHEVKECKILKAESSKKLVEFTISMMKTFKYTMWMTEQLTSPEVCQVSWEFASGDIFKTSTGSWKMQKEGDKTRGTYSVDASFSLFVPGPIAKALVSVNLPNMLSAYHKRVETLYGR